MKRSTLITIVVILAFVILLAWSTLSAQRVECEVCVTHRGLRNCATASAENQGDAIQAAKNTACGTISAGMDDRIACGRAQPEVLRCQTR